MRAVRAEMRRHRAAGLSVPQFRTLGFVGRQAGASLSAAAEHMGLTPPSMSVLVDGLVVRKLIARAPDPRDRRRVTLTLTSRGRTLLERTHRAAEARFAEKLAVLCPDERAAVQHALRLLRDVFEQDQPAGPPAA
jgi:DNA-binding MarR family transcriptional regulator